MAVDRQFAIAGELLAGAEGDARWNNLGYWRAGDDYTAACRALARLHAEAISLGANDRLLELACGHGAALELWRDEFSVTDCHALEVRNDCISAIRRRDPARADRVVQGRFDRPLPDTLPRDCDALICVDAVYHADSLDAFLKCAASVLKENGRIAFTTLVAEQNSPVDPVTALLLNLAHIPPASRPTRPVLEQCLQARGFQNVAVTDISEPVLSGFASWVRQCHNRLTLMQRLRPEWLKIEMSARLCRRLIGSKSWNYVLVSARRYSEVP